MKICAFLLFASTLSAQTFGISWKQIRNPPAATIIPALNIIQSGPTSGNQAQQILYNSIKVNSDHSHIGSSDYAIASDVEYTFGGANMIGGPRLAFSASATLNAASDPANTQHDYVAITGICTISAANDNGTDTGAGAKGACGAGNFVSQASGTNLFSVGGIEIDTGLQPPGTSRFRLGVSSVATGYINGASLDAAFDIGASVTGVGGSWGNGIVFSNIHGSVPVKTTGCLICTDGSADTVTTGIDLSSYTISGNFLKGPGAFSVTGAGALAAPSTNVSHYLTSGSAPTCSSTGIGTGTCMITGTDSAGVIGLAASGAPSASGAVTLTFNSALGATSARCVFGYQNGAFGWSTPLTLFTLSSSTAAVVVQWGQSAPLSTGANGYQITYLCQGQ